MRALGAVVLAAVAAAGAAARPQALPQQLGQVDLALQANAAVRGALAGDEAGDAVAAAGDVNGDGRADLVVGAPGADANGRTTSGSAFVVFGPESPGEVDLATLGARGLRLDGAAAGDRTGSAVAGVGDVNGDGRADVLVGAQAADPSGRSNAGSAFVVFGTGAGGTVDLAALGEQGFRIDGASPGDRAGWAAGAAGDVNGDGLADVLVGAPFADNNLRPSSGSVYVVFGRRTTAPVDLATLGEQGFRIDGGAAQDFVGEALGPAGDLNQDGRGDVLVGATFADPDGRVLAGSAYVVFGKATLESVDLAALGPQGFRIDGAAPGDGAGAAVAAGDLDGDRRPDLLVGAVFADAAGRQGSGSAYVLFNPRADLDLAALGEQGFRIAGAAPLDFAGGALAGPGDVNGDGRADVLVGAAGADAAGRADAGAAYVVFGKEAREPVDLATLGERGFRIDGGAPRDSAGVSVAAPGDVNGDGRADVLVGAPGADHAGRTGAGSAYVVYGFGAPELAYAPVVARAGRPFGPRPPALVRRTGPARFSVSPLLPTGLRLDARTGAVTGTPLTYAPRATHTVRMTDLAGTVRALLTVTVTDARAPRLTLAGPRVQDVRRHRTVVVRASCDEPCVLRATGRARVLGTAQVIALRSVRARLDAAGATLLRLPLARALPAGARARATVTVRAVDRAGNASAATRTLRLRG
jgi:hypothetical protein